MMRIKFLTALSLIILLPSCTYVLQKDLMKSGTYDINPADLRQDTSQYSGTLYILGGIIAKTTATDEGTLIEAIYVPVDSRGYLKDTSPSNWRFLALSREDDFLDPLIFSRNKKVTIAGVFKETRKGMIGDMEYTFPLFDIREIHLWEETIYKYRYYYPDYYYYPYGYFRYRHYYPSYPYYYWWYY